MMRTFLLNIWIFIRWCTQISLSLLKVLDCWYSILDNQMTVWFGWFRNFYWKKTKDIVDSSKKMGYKVLNTRIELVTSAVLMLCYNQLNQPSTASIHCFQQWRDIGICKQNRYKISPFIYPCLLDLAFLKKQQKKEESDENN